MLVITGKYMQIYKVPELSYEERLLVCSVHLSFILLFYVFFLKILRYHISIIFNSQMLFITPSVSF